jgi:hypothetical protein
MNENTMTEVEWKQEMLKAYRNKDAALAASLASNELFYREYSCGIECCGLERGPYYMWAETQEDLIQFILDSI